MITASYPIPCNYIYTACKGRRPCQTMSYSLRVLPPIYACKDACFYIPLGRFPFVSITSCFDLYSCVHSLLPSLSLSFFLTAATHCVYIALFLVAFYTSHCIPFLSYFILSWLLFEFDFGPSIFNRIVDRFNLVSPALLPFSFLLSMSSIIPL